jgi:hypothetical protein
MGAGQWSTTAYILSDSVWPLLTFVAIAVISIFLSALSHWSKQVRRRRQSRDHKVKILALMHEACEYISVDPSSIPGLRLNELHGYTQFLEREGFRKLADSRLLFKGEAAPRAFDRCLVNEGLRCFADLFATQKTIDVSGPLRFSFSSYMENGWSIESTSSNATKIGYVRRLPRSLVQWEPRLSIEELLRRHLKFRDRVMSDLGITPQADISLEGYRQSIDKRLRDGREAFMRRDILEEWTEAARITQDGHWEWLGDCPGETAQRENGAVQRQPVDPI